MHAYRSRFVWLAWFAFGGALPFAVAEDWPSWRGPQGNGHSRESGLPIRWDATAVHVGDKSFSADHHLPALIYPNPLNPKRYVVLNSGFTFREYDYLNNARQVPKLPDWAVLDISVPASSRFPAKVVTADFFDEEWKLRR